MVKNCWNINGYESKTHNPHYVKYTKLKFTIYKYHYINLLYLHFM